MTFQEKKKHLQKLLIEELGSKAKVKEFVELLSFLDICNLSDETEFDRITQDEGARLLSLIVYYNWGILHKLESIKKHIKSK